MTSTLLFTETFNSFFPLDSLHDSYIAAMMLTSRGLCNALSANVPSYTASKRGTSDAFMDLILENISSPSSLSSSTSFSPSANHRLERPLATGPTASFLFTTRINLRLLRYDSFLDECISTSPTYFEKIAKLATHLKEVRITSTFTSLASYESSSHKISKMKRETQQRHEQDVSDTFGSCAKMEMSNSNDLTQLTTREMEREALRELFYANLDENRVLTEKHHLAPILNLGHLEILKIALNINTNNTIIVKNFYNNQKKRHLQQRKQNRRKNNKKRNDEDDEDEEGEEHGEEEEEEEEQQQEEIEESPKMMTIHDLFSYIATPSRPIFRTLTTLDISGYKVNQYENGRNSNGAAVVSTSTSRNQNNDNNNTGTIINLLNDVPPVELLENLPNLQFLYLSGNDFRGKIDSSTFLAKLPKNIRVFHAKQNKLAGNLDFTDLPLQLQDLNLSNNWFTNVPNFEQLADHPSLRHISLHQNNFSPRDMLNDPAPDLTLLPPNLVELVLSRCNLHSSEKHPLDLTRLPKTLESLYLFSNAFKGQVDLTKLPSSLINLSLENNEFSGKVDLTKLPPKLRVLHLGRNKFNHCFAHDELTHLPASLYVVYLCWNEFTNDYNNNENDEDDDTNASKPLDLSKLPDNLDQLYMQNNKFKGPLQLGNLPRKMNIFCATNNNFISLEGMDSLPPSLIKLELSSNDLTNNGRNNNSNSKTNVFSCLSNLKNTATSLMVLDLSRNKFTGKCDLTNLPESLETLYLNGNLWNDPNPDLSKLPMKLRRLDVRVESRSTTNNTAATTNNNSDSSSCLPTPVVFASHPEAFYNIPQESKLFSINFDSDEFLRELLERQKQDPTFRKMDSERLPPSLRKMFPFSSLTTKLSLSRHDDDGF